MAALIHCPIPRARAANEEFGAIVAKFAQRTDAAPLFDKEPT